MNYNYNTQFTHPAKDEGSVKLLKIIKQKTNNNKIFGMGYIRNRYFTLLLLVLFDSGSKFRWNSHHKRKAGVQWCCYNLDKVILEPLLCTLMYVLQKQKSI